MTSSITQSNHNWSNFILPFALGIKNYDIINRIKALVTFYSHIDVDDKSVYDLRDKIEGDIYQLNIPDNSYYLTELKKVLKIEMPYLMRSSLSFQWLYLTEDVIECLKLMPRLSYLGIAECSNMSLLQALKIQDIVIGGKKPFATQRVLLSPKQCHLVSGKVANVVLKLSCNFLNHQDIAHFSQTSQWINKLSKEVLSESMRPKALVECLKAYLWERIKDKTTQIDNYKDATFVSDVFKSFVTTRQAKLTDERLFYERLLKPLTDDAITEEKGWLSFEDPRVQLQAIYSELRSDISEKNKEGYDFESFPIPPSKYVKLQSSLEEELRHLEQIFRDKIEKSKQKVIESLQRDPFQHQFLTYNGSEKIFLSLPLPQNQFNTNADVLDQLKINGITTSFSSSRCLQYMAGLPQLNHLGLQLNKIVPLTIIHFTKLNSLDLSGNQIKNLPNLTPLKELKWLNISQNKIKKLPEWLSKMTHLNDLIVYDNPLKEIPGSILNMKNTRIEADFKVIPWKHLKHKSSSLFSDRNYNSLKRPIGSIIGIIYALFGVVIYAAIIFVASIIIFNVTLSISNIIEQRLSRLGINQNLFV